jgi:hypothetical protein
MGSMRRMIRIVALAAVVVAIFATAAYAATAVYGTNGNDQPLNESSGFADDRIHALGGNDYINAVVTWGTIDTDKLFGGKGNDDLAADDGDIENLLNGGPGYDRCWGSPGERFVNCEEVYATDTF